MPQRLKAVTLIGSRVPKQLGRVPTITLMVPADDAQLRIDVECPIWHCGHQFGGVVTFVVSAIHSKREMPDPAACSECGNMVRLTQKNLDQADVESETIRTESS